MPQAASADRGHQETIGERLQHDLDAMMPLPPAPFGACDRGFFGDLEVKVSKVGYDQVQALLLAGDTDVPWISPIETAQFVSEGADFRYFSTAGAQNMYNGIVVRAEDAEIYASVPDLKGKRLDIPGYGTGA